MVVFTLQFPSCSTTSLCLLGADKDDGWFFVSIEFLINVGGDLTGLQGTLNDEWYIHFLFVQQQCRVPANTFRNHKRHITDEAQR